MVIAIAILQVRKSRYREAIELGELKCEAKLSCSKVFPVIKPVFACLDPGMHIKCDAHL